jgi:hypothetical protein
MAAREEELTLQCECASRSGRAQRKSGGQRRERSREARPLDILADARKTWRSVAVFTAVSLSAPIPVQRTSCGRTELGLPRRANY